MWEEKSNEDLRFLSPDFALKEKTELKEALVESGFLTTTVDEYHTAFELEYGITVEEYRLNVKKGRYKYALLEDFLEQLILRPYIEPSTLLISIAYGFSNLNYQNELYLSYFSKKAFLVFFKKETGMTPSQYRQIKMRERHSSIKTIDNVLERFHITIHASIKDGCEPTAGELKRMGENFYSFAMFLNLDIIGRERNTINDFFARYKTLFGVSYLHHVEVRKTMEKKRIKEKEQKQKLSIEKEEKVENDKSRRVKEIIERVARRLVIPGVTVAQLLSELPKDDIIPTENKEEWLLDTFCKVKGVTMTEYHELYKIKIPKQPKF